MGRVGRMRAFEKGTPSGETWNSSIHSSDKFSGIYRSTHPPLTDFYDWSISLSPAVFDAYSVTMAGDQTGKLKPGYQCSITEPSGNIVDDHIIDVNVIRTWYQGGVTLVTFDTDVSSYNGKTIRGDTRLSERHDPVQIYDGEPEFEITADLLNHMMSFLDLLTLTTTSNLTVDVKQAEYIGRWADYDVGTRPAVYTEDSDPRSNPSIQAAYDESVSFAENDWNTNVGNDPDNPLAQAWRWYDIGSSNVYIYYETWAQNNQKTYRYSDSSQIGYGGHSTGGHSSVYMMLPGIMSTPPSAPPYAYICALYGMRVAVKITKTGSVGKGIADNYAILVTGRNFGTTERDKYRDSGRRAYIGRADTVNVDLGNIKFSASAGAKTATNSGYVSSCGGWTWTEYSYAYKDFQHYMPVRPTGNWNVSDIGEPPVPDSIPGSTYRTACNSNYDRMDYAYCHKKVRVDFLTTALVEILHITSPASIWERDTVGHIDRVNPPVTDTNPPKPDPPVLYYGPQAYFKYIEEFGTPGDTDYEEEHFELWVKMIIAISEDLEGSTPIRYRSWEEDQDTYTSFDTTRTIDIPIRDLTMNEAIGKFEYDLSNTSSSHVSGDVIRLELSSLDLSVGDSLYLNSNPLKGTFEITNIPDSTHVDIDLTTGGSFYPGVDFDFTGNDEAIVYSDYSSTDWLTEPCKFYLYHVQSKDSATVENIGKWSKRYNVLEPEQYPLSIYLEATE
jgi:hypothetical protein